MSEAPETTKPTGRGRKLALRVMGAILATTAADKKRFSTLFGG